MFPTIKRISHQKAKCYFHSIRTSWGNLFFLSPFSIIFPRSHNVLIEHVSLFFFAISRFLGSVNSVAEGRVKECTLEAPKLLLSGFTAHTKRYIREREVGMNLN